jgi:hypothetical protein
MPSPPSAFHNLQVDPPVVQNAQYRLDANDRAYIDDQIRSIEQYLVIAQANGIIGTYALVDGSSPAINVGDVLCSFGQVAGIPTVTRASATVLASAQGAYGIALVAANPGAKTLVAVFGLIPPSITQLSAVSGAARINISTGRCQTVGAYVTGDFPLGPVDAAGNLNLSRQAGPILATPGVYLYLVASTSPSAPAGSCVCTTSADPPQVTLANATALGFAFAVLGVALDPVVPNTLIRVCVESVVSKSVTGLSGQFGIVRCNTTTGGLQVVSAYQPTDYPMGGSNSGVLTMVRGLAVGASVPFDFPQAAGFVDQFDGATATVSSWASLVGSNVLQPLNSGHNPTLLTSDITRSSGAGNALSFNGSTAAMYALQNWTMNGAAEWTMYAVMALLGNGSANPAYIIMTEDTSVPTQGSSLTTDNSGTGEYTLRRNNSGAAGVSYAVNMIGAGYHIVSAQYRSDGSNEIFVDGTSRGTFTDSSAPALHSLVVGSNGGQFAFANFKIAYLLNYSSRHDSTTLQNVHTKLRQIFPSLP